MNYSLLVAVAIVAAAPLDAAFARDVVVEVDSRSGPWSLAVNGKSMPYGSGDQLPPTVVPFDIGAGKIAIFADGTTSVSARADIGPAGIEDDAVDDTLGQRKARFPSFYTPKILYPANRHALTAVFVDDQQKVVGRPFMIGRGVRVPIPENVAGLAFGFNDTVFAGNSGRLKVTLQLPE